MAKRSSSLLSNKYVKYGLYAAIAYYGYNWWMGRSSNPLLGPQQPPAGTQ